MTKDARESLVRAAQQLYALSGVAATTPRHVIERSGVGHGSLYHHFPSKRDLALAAVSRTVEESLASSAVTLNAEADSRARIAAYLERPREATSGCRIGRLTADPFVATDEGLSAIVASYFIDLINLVAGVFEEQGLDVAIARDRATAAVAVIQGGYVLSRATDDDEPMRSAIRGFLDLVDAPQREEDGA